MAGRIARLDRPRRRFTMLHKVIHCQEYCPCARPAFFAKLSPMKKKQKVKRSGLRIIITTDDSFPGHDGWRVSYTLSCDRAGRFFKTTPHEFIPLTASQAVDLFTECLMYDGASWSDDGLKAFSKLMRRSLTAAGN
jgi:hypothetical protein